MAAVALGVWAVAVTAAPAILIVLRRRLVCRQLSTMKLGRPVRNRVSLGSSSAGGGTLICPITTPFSLMRASINQLVP